MNIGETLKLLRKEKDCTQTDAAKYLSAHGCNVTQRAVSKWERGETQPNGEQLLLLCKFYNVHDILTRFCGVPDIMSGLNSAGKKRVYEYIRLLEKDSEFSAEKPPVRMLRTIPLYDLPVSAGTGQFLDSSDYELIEVSEDVPDSAAFAVRVSGDSMIPRFNDGEIVYVRQQQTLEHGDFGIFVLNGDVYCKQLSGDDETQLVSINKAYAPIMVKDNDELFVLGKVL